MKEFDITLVPFVSVGPLRFGMHQDEVRKIMSAYGKGNTFRRDVTSNIETDEYFDSELFLGYDENGLFQFAEVVDMEVILKGKILNIMHEKELFKMTNNKYEIIDGMYFLDELGVLISVNLVAGEDADEDGLDNILLASKSEYKELKDLYNGFDES
jgi:hypothetical protein